jgi:hypothetical protein
MADEFAGAEGKVKKMSKEGKVVAQRSRTDRNQPRMNTDGHG